MTKRTLKYLVFGILFPLSSISQSISKDETVKIERIIYWYFVNQGPQGERQVGKYQQGRPAEALFCFLAIDSNGRVGGVNFLVDDKNRDSAYVLFSKMTSADFMDWNCEKCKNKTIMIPITVRGYIDPKYVKDITWAGFFNKTFEANNLIILRGMFLDWPKLVS